MIKKHCEDVTILEATTHNFEFIYNLKCEKSNIYWGGFKAKPDYEKLNQWFNNIISSRNKVILIVQYKKEDVGCITFRIDDTKISDFSIAVAKKFSNKGIATQALNELMNYLNKNYSNCKTFYSYVRADNIPSQIIHKKTGFQLSDEYENRFLESDNKIIRLEKWVKEI